MVRLSPPGWGAPVPPDWGATVEEYRRWLVGELERIGGPVDLVGHDWGGAHVLNVAMTRPDLLRSWCSDVLGCFDPDYEWHPLAQIWQTPGRGEEAVAALVANPTERLDDLAARGLDRAVGERDGGRLGRHDGPLHPRPLPRRRPAGDGPARREAAGRGGPTRPGRASPPRTGTWAPNR